MNNEEKRVIPKKNYIVLGIIILVTILLLYYFYMWFDAYKETKLNMRILDNYMEIINYNELDDYLVENPRAVIYVSVLEDNTIREFEKKVKKLYKSKEISQNILYMDVTNDINNERISNSMQTKYGISKDNIPLVLVFSDGEVKSSYSVSSANYDVESFKFFLNSTQWSDIDG